jgi:predicted DNA-binding transcriptional regulator YafY
MSLNKNALMRYKVLDSCFRNPGKRYFIDDLIEACNSMLSAINPGSNGISRRQVFEDIAFMESEEGWSIDLKKNKDGRKVYYRYSDLSFSINNMPLNEVELNQLKSAVNILSQFKGMPQFEWMHELLPKLQEGFTSINEKDSIIDFDNNQYLKGIEFLGPLYNSITYRKVLRIDYQPFEAKQPFNLVLHPYYLKQYNNRWFLFGHNPDKNKDDWNLALDRIVSVSEVRAKYKKNSIDWNEYFEDIIGVTKPNNAQVEHVVLNFFGLTGKYIESKPLHGSQKSKWIGEILQVNLDVIINYEFERLILSYAESCKVLGPMTFQKVIQERLSTALQIYSA